MNVFVNNKEVSTSATHLSGLMAQLNLPPRGVAAAIAGEMVPNDEWDSTPLAEGMQLIVIKAACGG